MFSTSGYFKDIPCPFHEHGLCHRPYCHYKHTKKPSTDDETTPTSTQQLSNTYKPKSPSAPVAEPKPVTVEDIFGSSTDEEEANDAAPIIPDPESMDSTTPDPAEPISPDPDTAHTRSITGTPEASVTALESPGEDYGEDYDDDGGDYDEVEEMSDNTLQRKFEEATQNETRLLEDGERETDKERIREKYENKGIKKKRLAHSNDKVVRDTGVSLVAVKAKTSVDEKLKDALNDPNAVFKGRKRNSHTASSEAMAKKGTQNRPKLPVTMKAKIPTKIRQQFLDSFIDEFIKMGEEPTVSYTKALDKEKSLFEKCSSTMIYRNKSTLELIDLRKTVEQELKERRERSDKRVREQSMDQTPPTDTNEVTLVKKPTTDSAVLSSNKANKFKPSGSLGKLTTPSSSNTSKHILIPVKSILNGSKEVGLGSPSNTNTSLDSSSQLPKQQKISLSQFYSDKKKRRRSEEGSDEEESHDDRNKPAKKQAKMDLSFGAAIGKIDSVRKKKMAKMKEKKEQSKHMATKEKSINEVVAEEVQRARQHEVKGAGQVVTVDYEKLPSSQGAPPTGDSLINLSQLRKSTVTSKSGVNRTKKVKRIINKDPPKPQPPPSFGVLPKKRINFNSEIFYSKLAIYLLSEEQLVDNGYPRTTNDVGVASIKRETIIEPIKDESLGSNAMRHKCCRCGQGFIIYNKGEYQSIEECTYHSSRSIKSREYGEGIISKYRCCGERQGSPGCQVAMMHVTAGTQLPTESGYIESLPPPPVDEGYTPQVYSMDCEMVYTTLGLQLARVTIINMDKDTVLEALVKPSHTIVDYNTRFSGLTPKDFVNVETSLADLHRQLESIIYSDTILIGHSLESDLKSVKLIHSKVVDTAIVFPHRKGLPFKRGLKELTAEQLGRFIQDNVEGGHDSREDAEACMDLMVMKVKNDLKADARRKST